MRLFPVLKIAAPIAAICLGAQGQNPPGQSSPAKAPQIEIRGLPPRPTLADYPDQGQAGKVTIGAEFQGHAVPTEQGNLTTEDYVVVETGFFGPPGTRITLSPDDFTLRINQKKVMPSQPYGVVLGNVKDPEWVPPEPPKPKEKNLSIGGDEEGQQTRGADKEPPFPVKVPLEVQRALNLRVQKAALPEGDRAVPVAGLVFFRYGGKTEKIHTIELIYTGSAGKATLTLEP
ncbi:MAG: hypothetical protein WB579_23380 [Bryobacteraceae bacterium]